MNFLREGKFDELYEYILRSNDFSLDRTTTVDLDYALPGYPENYMIVGAIYDFISEGGPALWNALLTGDICYVRKWILSGGNRMIRHPVSGDTIAHVNYGMCRLLRKELQTNYELELNYMYLEAGTLG